MAAMRVVAPGGRGPVTVAVVGAGETGRALAGAVLGSPAAELAAVCDRSLAALTRIAPFHPGTRLVRDFSEILEDPRVEAVIVATPAAARFSVSLAALAAGKHVLVHGRPAADAAKTQQLGELADRQGLTIMAGAALGHAAAAEAVGRMIAAGRLGEVRFVSTSVALAGADAFELAAAELMVLTGWLGDAPRVVHAAGGGPAGVVFVTLAYPGGPLAHVEVAPCAPAARRHLTVAGAQATALIERGRLRVLGSGGEAVEPPLAEVDAGGAQVREFLAALAGGRDRRDSFGRVRAVAALTDEIGRLLDAE